MMTMKKIFSENFKFVNEQSQEITEKNNLIIFIPHNDGEEIFDFHFSQLKNNGNKYGKNNLDYDNGERFIHPIKDGDKKNTTNIVKEVSNNLYNGYQSNEVEDEDVFHFSLSFFS
jgi:hypothetical protein